MKLADLRALHPGAPLLADLGNGLDAEPVVFARPNTARSLRVRVLAFDGTEHEVHPDRLTPAPPGGHPDLIALRPDLEGRTITIEHVTARVWPLLGLGRGAIGQLAAVERQEGRLVKVCCIQSDLWGGNLEEAARAFAEDCGARYVAVRSISAP